MCDSKEGCLKCDRGPATLSKGLKLPLEVTAEGDLFHHPADDREWDPDCYFYGPLRQQWANRARVASDRKQTIPSIRDHQENCPKSDTEKDIHQHVSRCAPTTTNQILQ